MLKSLFVFSHNEMNVLGHVLHAKRMLGKRQGASVPAGYLHWLIPGATDSIETTNTQFSSFLFSLLQGFFFQATSQESLHTTGEMFRDMISALGSIRMAFPSPLFSVQQQADLLLH